MPLSLLITKLLLLTSVIAYEYGYQPSAEEFDNLMRETSRTWTRDLIANERRRTWVMPPNSQRRSDNTNVHGTDKRIGEYFVPKYKYETERPPYESTLNLKWPGYAEKILKKPTPSQAHTQIDQESAASLVSAITSKPSGSSVSNQHIASSLDFTMFSNEMSAVHSVEEISTTVTGIPVRVSSESAVSAYPVPTKATHGTVIQVNSDSSERAQTNSYAWHNKYSINNLYSNNSEAHFPIFFTNPVTGIVYAITEIGKMDGNLTKTQKRQENGTIPIYITKEQYDRDIFLLKKRYENKCPPNASANPPQLLPTASSAISGSLTTTHRPQIIRLQRPSQAHVSVSKLPSAKLPTKLSNQKPPPVMVQSAVTVSDQVQLPPPKRLQKLKNKKKKKKKPGRKSVGVITTASSLLPHVIVGTRTSTTSPGHNKDKPYTQLERPNLPATATIFSSRPIASTSGYVIPKPQIRKPQTNFYTNHRLSKRSLPVENSTIAAPILNSTQIEKPLNMKLKTKITAIRRMPTRKKPLPHLSINSTSMGGSHFLKRNQSTTIRFIRKKNLNTTPNSVPNTKSTTARGLRDPNHKNQTTLKSGHNHRTTKPTKREKDNDSGFDLFDLLDDDSHDDDEENERDDEYYYYEDHSKSPTKKPKRHIIRIDSSSENSKVEDDDDEEYEDDDETETTNATDSSEDPFDELKEQNTHDNSSSAEEGADFGALEEVDIPVEEQQEATPQLEAFSSETKNTYGKKRIRRRPPAAVTATSYEDFIDDDDDGDGDSDGGMVGGFFRMLFYPVQVAMTSIYERLAGGTGEGSEEDDDSKPPYPAYTQYHSASQTAAETEEADEVQGNSLSSWFSSLFGFNRRTKKIGSTTTAPPPLPTEAPGWFDSWFGFGGNQPATDSAEIATSYEDYDDYDKWFSSWFNTKPKAKRRTTSTTTTTPTFPQVPILTIVDPMKNPQNWLGILAHHIINSTATTTHNPIVEALTRATTTENPDIPRFISYDKYQIWRLKPQDETQVKALEEYKRTDEGSKLQWLKGPSLRGLTDVLVPPKMLIDFQGTLQFESIAHEILIFDVGKAIAYEQGKEQYYLTTPRPSSHQQKYSSLINMSWSKYYSYDDIIKYLESIRMRHPQIVELFHIGRTYEGRPLVVVKLELKRQHAATSSDKLQVSHKKLKHKKKSGLASAVFIEAGTHGLEWIGPATATWMINELLRVMKTNKTSEENEYIKNTTWYIMPVLNPDGYVYSHEYDRFWRKSRSRHISRPSGLLNSAMTWLQQKTATEKVCYGVDLDRNWHYHWGKRGSSKSPCNDQFAGPVAFSEPETKALSEFLMDNRKQIKLYISMQAYGQIVSYPSKTNNTFDTERSEDFMDVAMVGTDGLRKKGSKSRYKVDSSNDLIENRAGCSDAFAAYEVGIPFSYTLYLADNGVHGYLLPSSSIDTTSRDAFEIITSMLDYI